jgi:hypothetical protein
MSKDKTSNIIDLNKEAEYKAMKQAITAMSKQLDATIQTTREIIEKYNQVITFNRELFDKFNELSMDNRLTKNILNQLKSFFEQNFPSHMNQPHFQTIKQLCDLLIDGSEEGIKNKINFFEEVRKQNEAKKA